MPSNDSPIAIPVRVHTGNLSFRDKVKLLIDLGFEIGAHREFMLGPADPTFLGSQCIFNPPDQTFDEDDPWEDEPLFHCIEDLEAVIDAGLVYASERGLIAEPTSVVDQSIEDLTSAIQSFKDTDRTEK